MSERKPCSGTILDFKKRNLSMLKYLTLNPVSEVNMSNTDIISTPKGRTKTGRCIACGTDKIKARRRYCSKECRRQVLWVLSLSNGLLKVFNARYAAFTFSKKFVTLDVLPVWSKAISRFTYRRTFGKKPAGDLKSLILQSGEEWYHTINNKNSKSYASLFLLTKNHNKCIAPDAIKPDKKLRPRFSKDERKSVKLLKLNLEELISEGHVPKIKAAYKKLAKLCHPDVGGDTEKFKKLNEAHQQMLLWAENPSFTSKKALIDCWSYDGSTNKWSPPL